MGVNVNETRRDNPIAGIDNLIGVGIAQIANLCDPVSQDAHVGAHARSAGAVDQRAAPDDNIKACAN
jgi:hypothetical protein